MITQNPAYPETEPTKPSQERPEFDSPVNERKPAKRQLPPALRPWIIGAGVVLLIFGIWAIVRTLTNGAAAPRYITKPVAYADISSTVEETGTVNPVNEVAVGTQVSGTINSLSVDYNSIVHKGQVLATLDPTSLQATAVQVNGQLAAAQSNASAASSTASQSSAAIAAAVATANVSLANVKSAAANVAKAQAALALSQSTITRDVNLLAQGYISQSQMDTDRSTYNANVADVSATQAALTAARAQASATTIQIGSASDQHAAALYQASAAAAQAAAVQGQVQQAEYNLQRAVITSPIDGIVVSRAVSVGQTVAASLETPTLFVIASSLKDMQVDVSVSEADVGQLKTGAQAQISVPAFPNVNFQGTVQQVRINPTTVSNVVTYDAIVAVHDDSSRLKPGMTADVIIALTTHSHVLSIPAAALLFKPTGLAGSSGTRGSRSGAAGGAAPGGAAAGAAPGGAPAGAAPGGGASGGAAAGGGGAAPSGTSTVAGAVGSNATVWVLRGGKAVPVRIVIGISDSRNYEVLSGELLPTDQVIVGQLLTQQYSGTNPIAGGAGFGR
ncbi:MAG TPA: efflux RND transporter periplasmic adaptor subunit [Candidatus Eremiobacteraceae bacterium]